MLMYRKEDEKMQAEYIKEWAETYLQVVFEHMNATGGRQIGIFKGVSGRI